MLVLATVATVAVSGCKGADATKAATTPTGMAVGPENVAIVKAQQIRSGPAISGTLSPEEQANVRSEIGGAVLQSYPPSRASASRRAPCWRASTTRTCARPSSRRARR